MITTHDPLIGERRALQRRDNVVHRLDVPVEGHLQVDAGRTGAEAVGDRQGAAPRRRRDAAAHGREQRLGVAVGNRQRGNLRQRLGVRECEARRAGDRRLTRCERVAGVHRQVERTAALHAVLVAHRAIGEHLVHEVAVIARIGVDDAADGAVLRRDLRLRAAERPAVARNDDGALDRDAGSLEFLVVLGTAVVHVDQRTGDVAVDRVGVVGGQLLGLLTRGRINRHDRLFERRGEAGRRGQFEQAFLRCREQHVIGFELGVPAPLAEPRQHPLGIVLVVGRADVVRPRAEALHVLADGRGVGKGAQPLVPRGRTLRGEVRGSGGGGDEHGGDRQGSQDRSAGHGADHNGRAEANRNSRYPTSELSVGGAADWRPLRSAPVSRETKRY